MNHPDVVTVTDEEAFAFRYEIPRRDSEDDDVFFTHVPCGQEHPCWRVETLDVTGTRLENERCIECGSYLDEEPK